MTRWGIVGTGAVAADFAQGLRDAPGAQLVAVASRSAERAEAFARAVGAARGFGTLGGLLGDREVDAVYVATPNTAHAETALACIDAGKPVLCEKPFTVNAAEARKVVERARARRVFCMEAMWMRFVPLFGEIVRVTRAGAIGDVRMVSAQLGFPFAFDRTHRVFDPALAGGALLDLGVYALSFACALLGRPTGIATRAVIGESGVDEQAAAILDFDKGRQAVITTSIRHATTNDATIMGTDGILRVHAPLYCPESLTVVPTPRMQGARASVETPRALPLARLKRIPLVRGLRAMASRARAKTVTRRVQGNGMQYEAIEVMRCLGEGALESPTMPLDESIAIAEAMDTIRAAWGAR